MTPVEFERYKHVGISRYHDMGEQVLADGDVAREIDLGVINKHTMTERGMRYTARWHYDEEAKAWWQMSGPPDLWAGEEPSHLPSEGRGGGGGRWAERRGGRGGV